MAGIDEIDEQHSKGAENTRPKWPSPEVSGRRKKIPSNLSELPQNFTSIQTHSKATFLKDWRRSDKSCVHQHRWPDTQKSSKNGQFWRPRAVSYATSIFEKKACILIINSFLLSRSKFLAKKHKLWRMLDRDMKFSPSTSAREFSLEKRIFVCITTCAALVFTRLCLHQEVAFEHISQTSPGVRM